MNKLIFLFLFVFSFLFLFGCVGDRVFCGDGVCQGVEGDSSSSFYCPLDCGLKEPVCGDMVCEDIERDLLSDYYCLLDCDKKDCVCNLLYDPVCGVDGLTYSNMCQLECNGVDLDYFGECVGKDCAKTGDLVYVSDFFGPTFCCSVGDGIKSNSVLSGSVCINRLNGVLGSCVVGWDDHCGNSVCESELGEDYCNCSLDCLIEDNIVLPSSPDANFFTVQTVYSVGEKIIVE